MEKTITIVVTYNRLQLLSECINSLRNQTHRCDKILVVNNGSTDDTENWLRQQKDVEFISQGNTGSAGGFYTGIKWAYDNGYDWVWCMDDDGYPKEDALEALLDGGNNKLCLRNCAVLNKDDKNSFVWKTGCYPSIDKVPYRIIEGYAHPFNGTLIHRSIIEKVGFPKAELFIWGDETEYFFRIVKGYKIPFYTDTSSIHYHPATNYFYKNDWDLKNNWKMYYYVRNRYSILKAKHRNKIQAFLFYMMFLVAFSGLIFLFQKKNKIQKFLFICWPVIHALSDNFSFSPNSVLQLLGKYSTPLKLQFPLLFNLKRLWSHQPFRQLKEI